MKKVGFLFFVLLAIALAVGMGVYYSINKVVTVDFEAEHEERPNQPVLTGKEKAMFIEYLEKRLMEAKLKSAPDWTQSSYANGKIQGTWSPKVAQSGWFGYRVDNSAYDSLRKVFYVVSYAGHLYKLEYQDGINWTLLNHKIVLNPPSNDSPNPVFFGILMPNSTFRLIRSNDDEKRMEYSDDEGKTWYSSTGANIEQSPSNQAVKIMVNGRKLIVLHTYYSGYHHVYFSDDYGKTYKESAYDYPISDVDIRIAKPFYTNEAYLWKWDKSTKEINTYKYNQATKDFELAMRSSSTLAGSNLSSAGATYYNGKYHFYLNTINSGYAVYYSSDEGATWNEKNSGRDRPFEVICPDKPNTLISGYEDMKVSTDYGANWTGFGHKLGWDLQHMRTYEMGNGKHVTLAGLDFGCYISETPEDKNSYTWCNNGAWYGMHYDASSSENFNSIYMANQDRGATAYLDTSNYVNTVDVDGTDVLRVCFANHETSVWTWFYYGRIKHRYNFPTGKSGSAVYDGLGMWWAAPIVASPNPSEDAIYAAYGSNLQKFTYNPSTNSIAKTEHPFNFKSQFGDDIGGFGYSELNRNLWYTALNNGSFIYSHDAGKTWDKSSYSGSRPKANDKYYNYFKNQIVIRASQLDTNKVCYAGAGNFFLVSEDGGKNFTVKNKGLSISRMRDFAFSPDEKFIFAACGYGGAWVYSVEDDYWYQMSDDPIPSVDFTAVQFIKNKNCVRYSTYGSGIIELTLNNIFNTLKAPGNLEAGLLCGNWIELNWSDLSDNETGFYIERASDADFVCIDTLFTNQTIFLDKNTEFNKTYYYRIKAFNEETVSYKSNLAVITLPREGNLNKDNWSVVSVSSQEDEWNYRAPAKYAIDNDAGSVWHTEWYASKPAHPHYIVIDLGQESLLSGFRYLPRQDGNPNGNIANYEFYVSNDHTAWGNKVASGQFGTSSAWKEVVFTEPVYGRYVKLVALSEVNGKVYTSAAEIDILINTDEPTAPSNLTAALENDYDVRLSWNDNANHETGYIIEQLVNGEYIMVATVGSTTTNHNLYGLKPGTLHSFRIRSYNNGGASAPSNIAEIATNPSGLTGYTTSNLKVFPNPCSTHITVELLSGLKESVLRVIDMQGRTVLMEDISTESTSFDVSLATLPKGFYLIELITPEERLTQKIRKD